MANIMVWFAACSCDYTLTKANVRKKGLVCLTVCHQGKLWQRLKQEPEAGTEAKTMKDLCMGLTSMVFSYCFSTQPAQGWHHLDGAGPSPINHQSRNYLPG